MGLGSSEAVRKEVERCKADPSLDDVMIGLGNVDTTDNVKMTETLIVHDQIASEVFGATQTTPASINATSIFSIDDLLSNNTAENLSTPPLVLPTSTSPMASSVPVQVSKFEESKQSRIRGLDELNFLGETALRAHLPQKSPQFAKKAEKLPMNMLQKKKNEFPKPESPKLDSSKPFFENSLTKSAPPPDVSKSSHPPKNPTPPEAKKDSVIEDVKIADLFVPLTSIKPGIVIWSEASFCSVGSGF